MYIPVKKVCILFAALFMALCANAQSLENAFNEIAGMEGFEKIGYTAEEYGYPKELGDMRMTSCGNSAPREAVLSVLAKIPSEQIIAENNYKGKTRRWYMEDLENGSTVMMFVFIGKGGNDLTVQLFTGSSRETYHEQAKKIAANF